MPFDFLHPILPPYPLPTTSQPLAISRNCFYEGFCFCFLILHISEIMEYLSFSVWCISLSRMLSRFFCIVAHGRISLFFNGWIVTHCIYPNFFFFFFPFLSALLEPYLWWVFFFPPSFSEIWLIDIYKFQVYILMIWCKYTMRLSQNLINFSYHLI